MRDADAVLILTDRPRGLAASPGTALANVLAIRTGKPVLVVALNNAEGSAGAAPWLDGLLASRTPEAPLKLAIAGPRESEARGIYHAALQYLEPLLRRR